MSTDEIDALMKNLEDQVSFGPGIFARTTAPVSKDKAVQEAETDATNKNNTDDSGSIVKAGGPGSSDAGVTVVPAFRKGLSREEMLSLLDDMENHRPAARKISKLAHKIVGELPADGSKKKTSSAMTKKIAAKGKGKGAEMAAMLDDFAPEIGFVEAFDRIKELNLPTDPFEKYNINESRFQDQLARFMEDREVMMRAEQVIPKLHAPPADEPDAEEEENSIFKDMQPLPRRDLSLAEVCKVHESMIAILAQVLRQFQELPREVRHQYSAKQCETTAELLVSIGVEKKFKCVSDDVEASLIKYESALSRKQEFAACSQMLTTIMQQLIALSKPRYSRDEFKEYLTELCSQTKAVKAHVSKAYEGLRKGEKSFLDCYKEFETFTMSQAQPQDMLPPSELREHYDSYKYLPGTNKAKSPTITPSLTNDNDTDTGDVTCSTITTSSSSSSSSSSSNTKGKKDEEEGSSSTTKEEDTEGDSITTSSPKKKKDENLCPVLSKLWEESGAEVQTIMQIATMANPMMAMGQKGEGKGGAMSPFHMALPKIQPPGKKVQRLKSTDVVEMQSMMVDELKKCGEMFKEALAENTSGEPFKEQLVVGLVQALGSSAVEKKFAITAEEMAVAGFLHAPTLSTNQKFMQLTMEQQQILMGIAQVAGDPNAAGGCSVM